MTQGWEEKPPKHSGQQAGAQADKSDAAESPLNGHFTCDYIVPSTGPQKLTITVLSAVYVPFLRILTGALREDSANFIL